MSGHGLAVLNGVQFDLVVIGGGIIGTGVARDAAMRGLKVALFEKVDYCYGTSAEATRLIHGGLRYLEMYDFGLVREDLREREILLKLAPHLVFPLPFVMPFYDRSLFYRLKMRAGMVLYDVLSYDKSLPTHRILSSEEALKRVPALRESGLQGAATYHDAAAPRTERLCMENVISAQRNGAVVLNHAQVTGLHTSDRQVEGVRVEDTLTGQSCDVKTRLVINATGPWMNEICEDLGIEGKPLIRETKGVHLVVPKVSDDAVVLFSPVDGRLFFVIPWLDFSYLGTTDTDFNGDEDTVHADPEDVSYLLESVRAFMPGERWDPIYYSTAGVRSLVRIEGVPESSVSRKHVIFDHADRDGVDGLLSIVGGKLTAYRGIAEDAVDAACHKLGVRQRSRTARVALPGAGMPNFEEYVREQVAASDAVPMDSGQIEHLIRLYGTRYSEIAGIAVEDPELGRRLHPDYPDSRAQVIHAVRNEQARSLSDYMLRRSDVGLSASQGRPAIPMVAEAMAGLLEWDQRRIDAEIRGYQTHMDLNNAFRAEASVRS